MRCSHNGIDTIRKDIKNTVQHFLTIGRDTRNIDIVFRSDSIQIIDKSFGCADIYINVADERHDTVNQSRHQSNQEQNEQRHNKKCRNRHGESVSLIFILKPVTHRFLNQTDQRIHQIRNNNTSEDRACELVYFNKNSSNIPDMSEQQIENNSTACCKCICRPPFIQEFPKSFHQVPPLKSNKNTEYIRKKLPCTTVNYTQIKDIIKDTISFHTNPYGKVHTTCTRPAMLT